MYYLYKINNVCFNLGQADIIFNCDILFLCSSYFSMSQYKSYLLQNARQDLHTDVEYSTKSGFCYGVKLVRGAYLEQEREGALSKGTPLPIWNSKPETDQCYNDCVEYLIKAISRKNLQFMVATHNKNSVENTIQLLVDFMPYLS